MIDIELFQAPISKVILAQVLIRDPVTEGIVELKNVKDLGELWHHVKEKSDAYWVRYGRIAPIRFTCVTGIPPLKEV